MTTMLQACVVVPHLRIQLAIRHLAVCSPVAVIEHDTPHAPVLECCGQASAGGVAVGMAAVVAKRCCPGLHIVTLAPSILATAHATIDAVLGTYGDVVTQQACARWLLELRALGKHYAEADALAAQIQQAIASMSGLQATIGLATTTVVAQVAARAAHHDGSWRQVVLPCEEAAFLAPLPLPYLPQLGKRSADRLAQFGITTIGQFATLPTATVVQLLGARGTFLHQLARGIDTRRMSVTSEPFESQWLYGATPCADPWQLHAHIHRLTERVGRVLRAQRLAAGNITVSVRWVDNRQQQRTERFGVRYDLDRSLAARSRAALAHLLQHRRLAVRGLHLTVGDLGPPQHALFETAPRPEHRQQALDRIKQRHGTSAILFAWMLPPPS